MARPRFTALFAASMMLAASFLGVGIISVNASAALNLTTADLGTQFVPEYSYVDYRIGVLEERQMFDEYGNWAKIGSPDLVDSTLVCEQNEGANLSVADASRINDGTVYEFKARVNASASVGYLELKDAAGTSYVRIGFAATDRITVAYTNATGTAVTANVTSSYTTATYYMMAVEYGEGQFIASASHANGSLIGAVTVASFDLDYPAVEVIEIRQTAAGKAMTVDWMAQCASETDFTPASVDSMGLRTSPTVVKDYYQMQVDFGRNLPATFSDDPAVHAALGGSASDTSIGADREVNLTDFAAQLGSTREDSVPATGVAKFQGWDDLQSDNEAHLREYLAQKHGVTVDRIGIIDYYMSGASFNISWTASLAEQAKKQWYSSMKDQVGDLPGAEMVFADERTVTDPLHGYDDLSYVRLPNDVTQAQWDALRKAVSNDMRSQVIGCALVAQASDKDLADNGLIYIGSVVHGSEATGLDSAYQFTDALIGNVLSDSSSVSVDVQTVQDDQNWTMLEDGKPASTAATSMILLPTDAIWLTVVIVIVVVAAAAAFAVFGMKRRRRASG